MMRKFFLTALACLGLAGAGLGGDLGPMVSDGSLWKADKAALSRGPLMGMRYAPVDEHTQRIPRQGGGVQIGSLPMGELLMTWAADEAGRESIALLQTMVYNKGDDGAIDKARFDSLVEQATAALTELAGGQKPKVLKLTKRDVAVKTDAWQWEGEGFALRLEAASGGSDGGKKKRRARRGKAAAPAESSGFVAEFIRVSIGPDAASLEKGGADDTVRRTELKGQKRVEEDGTVWLDGIPMVDQGQKGYCVPASVARVFAFYGMDGVDQHSLAALCQSSGDGGTSLEGMEAALDTISRRFHVRMEKLDKGGMMEIMEEYNKAARKMGKPALVPSAQGLSFDPDVMLEARASKPKQLKKWLAPIRKNIDAGLPVLWSVQLIFNEPGLPQTGGGHMRMIIGYNAKEGTIIYSDSWGAMHAKKEMPIERAAAMTMRRYVLKPTK